MSKSPTADDQASLLTKESQRSVVEDLVGFIAVTAISVVAVFMVAGLFGGAIDELLRFGNLNLMQVFGGVL